MSVGSEPATSGSVIAKHERTTPSQSGDELGTWSYRQLLSMDRRFCERLERANFLTRA